MPEMHLRQHRFTYSVCGPFTKNKKRIKKFKETGYSSYIYRRNILNELEKTSFQYDMICEVFKDLPKRTASNKVLGDTAFNIAKSQKYDGYQRGLA